MYIYPPTKRSLEGSIAGAISSTISYYLITKNINLLYIIIFLYEGYTLEIDNLVLPIFAHRLFAKFN